MIHIGVCDDDIQMTEIIENKTNTVFKEMEADEDVEIKTYSKGDEVLAFMQQNTKCIDILLLDIDMPGISGLDVAKTLRETNANVIIIFISSHEDYVYDSLQYMPFRYIRKFRINEELPLALRAAYSLYKEDSERHIVIKSDAGERKVSHSEICYLTICKRKLHVHMENNSVIIAWRTIREFLDELNDNAFVRIDSGCAVNMKYIKEYSNKDVTLDNGEHLPASRAGIKLLKGKFSRYWSKRV